MTLISIQAHLEELGKSIDQIGSDMERNLQMMVAGIASQTRGKIVREAGQKLQSTREDYIGGVQGPIQVGENVYVIMLEGEMANRVESGWGAFDMKPGLLNGSKSKSTKDGGRYVTVPFRHSPSSKEPTSGKMLGVPKIRTKGGLIPNPNRISDTALKQHLQKIVKQYKLNSIIKDASGNPMTGKVASIKGGNLHSYLQALTKYQALGASGKVSHSIFMTFRRLSTKSAARNPEGWVNPGYKGVHLFQNAENFINDKVREWISTNIG